MVIFCYLPFYFWVKDQETRHISHRNANRMLGIFYCFDIKGFNKRTKKANLIDSQNVTNC